MVPAPTTTNGRWPREAGAQRGGCWESPDFPVGKPPRLRSLPDPLGTAGEREGVGLCHALCGVSGCPGPHLQPPPAPPAPLPSVLTKLSALCKSAHALGCARGGVGGGGGGMPQRGSRFQVCLQNQSRTCAGSQNPSEVSWEEDALLQADVSVLKWRLRMWGFGVCRWVGWSGSPAGLGAGSMQMVSVECNFGGGRRFG